MGNRLRFGMVPCHGLTSTFQRRLTASQAALSLADLQRVHDALAVFDFGGSVAALSNLDAALLGGFLDYVGVAVPESMSADCHAVHERRVEALVNYHRQVQSDMEAGRSWELGMTGPTIHQSHSTSKNGSLFGALTATSGGAGLPLTIFLVHFEPVYTYFPASHLVGEASGKGQFVRVVTEAVVHVFCPVRNALLLSHRLSMLDLGGQDAPATPQETTDSLSPAAMADFVLGGSGVGDALCDPSAAESLSSSLKESLPESTASVLAAAMKGETRNVSWTLVEQLVRNATGDPHRMAFIPVSPAVASMGSASAGEDAEMVGAFERESMRLAEQASWVEGQIASLLGVTVGASPATHVPDPRQQIQDALRQLKDDTDSGRWAKVAEGAFTNILAQGGIQCVTNINVAGVVAALVRSLEMRKESVAHRTIMKGVEEDIFFRGREGPVISEERVAGMSAAVVDHDSSSYRDRMQAKYATNIMSIAFSAFDEDGALPRTPDTLLGWQEVACLPHNVTLVWYGTANEPEGSSTRRGFGERLDALQSWFQKHWGVVSVCANHSGLDGTVFGVLESLLLPPAEVHVINLQRHGHKGALTMGLYSTVSRKKKAVSGTVDAAVGELLLLPTKHFIVIPTIRTDVDMLAAVRSGLATEGRMMTVVHPFEIGKFLLDDSSSLYKGISLMDAVPAERVATSRKHLRRMLTMKSNVEAALSPHETYSSDSSTTGASLAPTAPHQPRFTSLTVLRHFQSNFPDLFWAELMGKLCIRQETDLVWLAREAAGMRLRQYLAEKDDLVARCMAATPSGDDPKAASPTEVVKDDGIIGRLSVVGGSSTLERLRATDRDLYLRLLRRNNSSVETYLGFFGRNRDRIVAEEKLARELSCDYIVMEGITTEKNGHGRASNPTVRGSHILTVGWRDSNGIELVPHSKFGSRGEFKFPCLDGYNLIVCHNAKKLLLHVWDHPALTAFLARGGRVWCTQLAQYLLSSQTQRSGSLGLLEVAAKYAAYGASTEALMALMVGRIRERVPTSLHARILHDCLGHIETTFRGQIDRAVEQLQVRSLMGRMDSMLAMAAMEHNGIQIDVPLATSRTRELRNRLVMVEKMLTLSVPKRIPVEFRRVFDWASAKHVFAYFFGGQILMGTRGGVSAETIPTSAELEAKLEPKVLNAVAASATTPAAGTISNVASMPEWFEEHIFQILLKFGWPRDVISGSTFTRSYMARHGLDNPPPQNRMIEWLLGYFNNKYAMSKDLLELEQDPHADKKEIEGLRAAIHSGAPAQSMANDPSLFTKYSKGLVPSRYDRKNYTLEEGREGKFRGFRFVFFDLESTGLNMEVDTIVEMSFYDPATDETFSTLVNPERPIPYRTTRIHHLTQEMVREAPTMKDVLPQLIRFLRLTLERGPAGEAAARRLGLPADKFVRGNHEYGGPDEEVVVLVSHATFSLDEPLLRKALREVPELDTTLLMFCDTMALFQMYRQHKEFLRANYLTFNSLKLGDIAAECGLKDGAGGDLHSAEADTKLLWQAIRRTFNLERFQGRAGEVAGFAMVVARNLILLPHSHCMQPSPGLRHVRMSSAVNVEGVAPLYVSNRQRLEAMMRHRHVTLPVLEELSAAGCQVASLLIEKQLLEMHSERFLMFSDSGAIEVVHNDGRVRQDIDMTATTTSRTTSSNPSCQNIPKNGGLHDQASPAAHMRRLFCSRFKCDGVCLEVDYSQLEIAVQAVLSADAGLLTDLEHGVDFHCKRAAFIAKHNTVLIESGRDYSYEAIVAGCAAGDPDYLALRARAKIMAFQRMYGAGLHLTHKTINVPVVALQESVQEEVAAYPGVPAYQQLVKDLCLRPTNPGLPTHFALETPTGFRIGFTPRDVKYNLPPLKNYPIQGYAAELVQQMVGSVHREIGRAHV